MLTQYIKEFSVKVAFVALACLTLVSCGPGGDDGSEEKVRAATAKLARYLTLYIPDNYTVAARRSGKERGFIKGEFFFKGPSGDEVDDLSPVRFLLTEDGKTLVLGTEGVLSAKDLESSGLPSFSLVPQDAARAPMVMVSDDGRVIAAGRVLQVGTDAAAENRKKISLDGALTIGDTDARVAIVEYSDFQCPYCGQASSFVKEIMAENAGSAKLVYKNFPLSFHEWAYPAAETSYCFQKLGGNKAFKIFHDDVFARQQSINISNSVAVFTDIAVKAGVSVADFRLCMESGEMRGRVEADIKEAQALGVSGTPSFFVGGIMVPNDPDLLRKAVKLSLSEVY